MSSFELAGRVVGDGEPVFITFEAGPTHDGVESAKELVLHAANAGADAIKFQIIDPDRLVADRSVMFEYEVLVDYDSGEVEKVVEPLYDILARRVLSMENWRDVKHYSDSLGLAFFATVGFEDEIDLLESISCHSVKIASGDVNHFSLIRRAARTGMCLQLDTGSSTLGEIEQAVDVIRSEGNENIIIHQCPSGYPARLESINLHMITTLRQLFPYPIAFSDHTPGWEMDVAAVALGANLLEKTITGNRATRSVEHIFSLEPSEMSAFIRIIREVEIAMGDRRRVLLPEEEELRKKIRRSIYVNKDLESRHILTIDDLEFRRPGYGISVAQTEDLIGRKLVKKKANGELLDWTDLGKIDDK